MSPEIETLTEVARLTAAIVAVLIVVIGIIATFGITKSPVEFSKIAVALVQSGSVTRMATALVIVAAIIGLRVLDKISAEAAIASLSGIAGYVLGGARPGTSRDKSDSADYLAKNSN
jgi:hypothetical protein